MKWLPFLLVCCLPLRHLHLNSPFGNRPDPIDGQLRKHEGIDLRARSDTVFAVLNGIIDQAGFSAGLGLNVKIGHGEISTEYGHLREVFVKVHSQITAGTPIGITGRSGRATGEHLHFGVRYRGRPIDPIKFLSLLNQRTHE